MRIIVDIPEEQLSLLKQAGERDHLSCAEVIGCAITGYIGKQRMLTPEDHHGFGLWRRRMEDGLAMGQRLRKEW